MNKMTRINLIAITVFGLATLSSCIGPKNSQQSHLESDDAYFSSTDRKAEEKAEAAAKLMAERSSFTDQQDEKYGSDLQATNPYIENPVASYEEDDYYYSRRMRRFSNNYNNGPSSAWNYYDPYYSYDPYYNLNRPSWNSYSSNNSWWYDPYSYNGPSFSWTVGWGNGGYNNYGYGSPYSYWNSPSWNSYPGYCYNNWYSNCYSCNYYSNYNYGYYGYGGFYDPYWYGNNGGYYNNYGGYYNPYGNGGGGFSGTNQNNYHNGPRPSPSTLNTHDHPANEVTEEERDRRPYQHGPGYVGNGVGFTPAGDANQNGASQSIINSGSERANPNLNSNPARNPVENNAGNPNYSRPAQVRTEPQPTMIRPDNSGNWQTPPSNNAPASRPMENRTPVNTPRNDSPSQARPHQTQSAPSFSRPESSPPSNPSGGNRNSNNSVRPR